MKITLNRKAALLSVKLELTLIVSRREDMVFGGFGVEDMACMRYWKEMLSYDW